MSNVAAASPRTPATPLAAPSSPRFEHRTDAGPVLGIGTATPRLSWQVPTAADGYEQTAYEVEIVTSGTAQTHPVESGEQVLVPWPGEPLRSRESAQVRVRVRGDGDWSDWSAPATVEAGLLSADDWTARFVSPREIGAVGSPAPVLGGVLQLPDGISRARLYSTAHGIYLPELNGERVGQDELAPGWTAYQQRLRYQTYEVTDLVRAGENRLEFLVGNGWYRGRLGFHGKNSLYGDRLAVLAQLEVTTSDGEIHVFGSDETWTAHESAIITDDLYDGQSTDLRRVAGQTTAVDVLDADLNLLVAPDGPPVRVTDVLAAVEITTSPAGKTLVDFGQNLVGRVRLKVRGGSAGDEVVLRHAEVLENGELGVRPLRTAKATDSYILAGPDEVTLDSPLTFHGFRYAEVTGVPDLRKEDLEAVVINSDLRRTGWFESSHDLLNRFHDNVVWGMRGNFVDVPTDCPQRDERLGWTGDIQVFSPTASFLFDTAGFLTGWLADLAAEQQKDGSVPFVVPDILRQAGPATAAWGDAATIVPWVIYERTGDVGLLARQLPSMRAWVDRMADLAGNDLLWAGGFQFGDWLDPTAPPENPFRAKADPDVIATAHLARSAEVVAQAAELVGDAELAREYADLAARVRQAFAAEYTTDGGRVLSDAATTYALALQWALLPTDEQRRRAGERLADLVRTAGFRISTGFVGTPLMADALADSGHPDLAYRLLLQTGCPSWLYAVTMGATTVWERWDSMLPDGSINPGQMTSFNHYALGAVADWMHRRVAGLAPGDPGYRTIVVRPLLTSQLTSAAAKHLTPYGEAAVSWSRADGQVRLSVTVPVGSRAEVHVPGESAPSSVGHGTHEWTADDPHAVATQLPADASIRQLMDHEASWDAVATAARNHEIVTDDAELAARLERYLDQPAAQLVEAISPRGFSPTAEALQAELDGLLHP
ncbi:family 78 glycoside hydrolase catalytic domain [Kribbella sp. VKM Ac-2568]|uniref:family 78 glycoside hydrolase catalytic domain n=1 Tax=Kribbella sp. VKM Ac-2568 TaxID=2512219 RepID=UPI00104FA5BB|nr:family 78 glycoside hydrolase catalytic domain [Kribbella sp. VKM Ac-2568]TCM40318.1 alpha-L-rhamnosidase [Kribbella sp. VKM Ac-2568]